jgi:hypothetical protein
MPRRIVTACLGVLLLSGFCGAGDEPLLRVATFDVDATPPLGSPVAYARVHSVVDPLHAKGIVLLPTGQEPIVMCVFDWIGISNGGHDWWCEQLAAAAHTTPERVAVQTVHQHDGPQWDASAMALFAQPVQAEPHYDRAFVERVKSDVVHAIGEGLEKAQPVTHVGVGKAIVERVASNRRLLGPDGKVATTRYSSCRDPDAIAAPEGLIDPYLRLVSFWQHDQPLVCLAYYATHPMSHYGKGDVSADFPGLARAARENATHVMHLYFTGAGGNIAAGKYNDGSPERRPELAQRMEDGMRRAWEATTKTPLVAGQLQWCTQPLALPPAQHLDAAKLRTTLDDPATSDTNRSEAASSLAWLQRCQQGKQVQLSCLRLGPAILVCLPGELFVEYQLAAEAMRPDVEVCVAAYGDCGPGYIGTTVAYTQGGYETSEPASHVAPEVEPQLLAALRALLGAAPLPETR